MKDSKVLPIAIDPICSTEILPTIDVSTIPRSGVDKLAIIIGIAILIIIK